jgi:hypothetical protein
MYRITKLLNGKYWIECTIQDGTERWERDTRNEAISSLISAARSLNGNRITASDITFLGEKPEKPDKSVTDEEYEIIRGIRTRHLKVLPYDHHALKFNITHEECVVLQAIREGDLHLTDSTTGDFVSIHDIQLGAVEYKRPTEKLKSKSKRRK